LKRTMSSIFLGMISLILLGLVTCQRDGMVAEILKLAGQTMGTSYHISVVAEGFDEATETRLAQGVDSVLNAINASMSTWQEDSEISQFNRWRSTRPFPVSPEMEKVVWSAQALCKASGGAFDITVMPMVNFYGFGFEPGENRFPTVEEIDAWFELTGCDKLIINEEGLVKSDPRIAIDLSAIAKGYGADAVAEYLQAAGYADVFVEVGGEVVAHGLNAYRQPWRIGIDRPDPDQAPGAQLQHILALSDRAIATSGDYRNYREIQGRRVSHMMDPRSGYPIEHTLASVTVVASDCMTADGIATMLMILGVENGQLWLKANPGVDVLFISRTTDGTYHEIMTPGFSAYITE